MANDFLNNLVNSFGSDNVGDSVEKAVTDALGNKIKTSLNSSGNRVKTDLGSSAGRVKASLGSSNKVKTDLSSSSASKVKTSSLGSKLSGKSASFMSGTKNAINTMMNGVGESSNAGQTIEDNIMSALGNKISGKTGMLSALDINEEDVKSISEEISEEPAKVEEAAAPASDPTQVTCEYCGSVSPVGTRFCSCCGAKLG